MVIRKKIVCVYSIYELIKGHDAQFLCLPLLIENLEDEIVPVVEDLSKYSKGVKAFLILHN